MAAVDQRNHTATVFIAGIATEVENDRRESVMKLAQAHECRLKRFTPLFTTICRSQEVSQLSDQPALRVGEEGVIQNVTGDLSDDHRSFLTILDNVLNVGGLARVEKQADWLQL